MNDKNIKLSLFALPAILAGTFIAHNSGLALSTFAPNIGAFIAGNLFIPNINFGSNFFQKNSFSIALICISLIFLSLFSTGLETVHRWIAIGPVFLNVSMLLCPIIIYGVYASRDKQPLILSTLTSILFVVQPDAGQATAFCSAVIVIFLFSKSLKQTARALGISISIFLTAYAWFVPDPLQPVEHVERILHLAYNQSITLFSLAIGSVFLLIAPVAKGTFDSAKTHIIILPLSYFVYLSVTFIVTELGNFPVPVIGAGASSVMGWLILINILNGHIRKATTLSRI